MFAWIVFGYLERYSGEPQWRFDYSRPSNAVDSSSGFGMRYTFKIGWVGFAGI